MLSELWKMQMEQQTDLGLTPELVDAEGNEKACKDLFLGLIEELGELISETVPYKKHILASNPTSNKRIAEEFVDALKYLISIAILKGIKPEEVIEEFRRKTVVIEDKAKAERIELTENTKLVVIDMDGCLADHSSLDREIASMEQLPTVNVSALQEERKTAHREEGRYRDLPVIDGAVDAIATLKSKGYKIVILTARPSYKHKRLYADTLEWLNNNGIEHDLLLFHRDKAEAICKNVFPARPAVFVEDKLKHALEVCNLGVPVVLFGDHKDSGLLEGKNIAISRNWRDVLFKVWETEK